MSKTKMEIHLEQVAASAHYRVIRLVNTVEYRIGQNLTKVEVVSLTELGMYRVVVVGGRR